MLNETIVLKNPVYGLVKKVKPKAIRKIKFKPLSFDRISSQFRDFLIRLTEKELEKAKENLVSTEVSENGFDKGISGISKGEKKILKKATNVAKLEARINFLRTGRRASKDIVQSRAIKLKSNMMDNMRFNSNYVYSILPENADKIFEVTPASPVNNENPVSNNPTSEEDIQKKVAEDVQKILSDKQKSKQNPAVSQPDKQIIKDAVDEKFQENSDANSNDNSNNINTNAINTNNGNSNTRFKVSSNESTAAKINPFIGEDGTYHIKGTELDDELRYTHVDLSKYTPKFNTQQVGEGNISPIETAKAEFDDLPAPKKVEVPNQTTGINDDIFGKKEETSDIPITLTSGKREIPLVVPERQEKQPVNKFEFANPVYVKQGESSKPIEESNTETTKKESDNLHFDYSNASVKDLTNAVDKAQTKNDIEALIQRVRILKNEQVKTKQAAEDAAKKAEASQNAYNATVAQLRKYGTSLEAACNANIEKRNASCQEIENNQEMIQMMTEAMGDMIGPMGPMVGNIEPASSRKGK